MKKLFIIFSLFALLTAHAEIINAGEAFSADLNADGQTDALSWSYVIIDEINEDSEVVLTVNDVEYHTGMMFDSTVQTADVDGDGASEIFISGDRMSDDYVTIALQYKEGLLVPVAFENGWRGNWEEGFRDVGYGYVDSITDGVVTLKGTQDVLGTYYAARGYTLENGYFKFADTEWRVETDTWLTAISDIPAVFDGEGDTIHKGEKINIFAFDALGNVSFTTEAGAVGTLSTEPDEEMGWGVKIGGVNEETLFEELPYSD